MAQDTSSSSLVDLENTQAQLELQLVASAQQDVSVTTRRLLVTNFAQSPSIALKGLDMRSFALQVLIIEIIRN